MNAPSTHRSQRTQFLTLAIAIGTAGLTCLHVEHGHAAGATTYTYSPIACKVFEGEDQGWLWVFPSGQVGNTHPGATYPFGMASVCAYSGAGRRNRERPPKGLVPALVRAGPAVTTRLATDPAG